MSLAHVDINSHENNVLSFDITNAVYDWINEGEDTRSLKITGISYSDYFMNFYGVSVPQYDNRPTVIITYKDETGMIPYQDYSSYNSAAGTLFVNNYNLQPIFVFEDFSYSTPNGGISLTHIYNNYYKSPVNYGFGYNWNLNINKKFILNSNERYLLNADGYIKEFTKDEQDHGIAIDGSEDIFTYTNEAAYDNFGLLLASSNEAIYITTKDNLRYEFRKFSGYQDYHLVKINTIDQNKNVITTKDSIKIEYTSIDNKVRINNIGYYAFNLDNHLTYRIIDIKLNYSINNNLLSMDIKKLASDRTYKTIQKNYYGISSIIPNTLTFITKGYDMDLDGNFTEEQVSFSTDTNNKNLKSIIKDKIDELRIEYKSKNRISKVEYYKGDILKNIVNRTYYESKGNSTFIQDLNGNTDIRYYDDFGRYSGSKNSFGLVNKIDYTEQNEDNINYNTIHKIINTSRLRESNASFIKNGEFERGLREWDFDGDYSLYTCDYNKKDCQERVNSGQSSLLLKQTPKFGVAKQTINLEPGIYSISAYVRNTINSIKINVSNPNVEIISNTRLKDKSNKYMELYRLDFINEIKQDITLQITFKDENTGYAYIDDVKLVKQYTIENRNLLVNASFEEDKLGYSFSHSSNFSVVDDEVDDILKDTFGNRTLLVKPNGLHRTMKQTIYIPSLDEDTRNFTFGGSIKTRYKSVSRSIAKIMLKAVYVDDGITSEAIYEIKANPYIHDEWQSLCRNIKVDENKNLDHLELILEFYDIGTSEALVENLYVIPITTGNEYEYDDSGNLNKVINSDGKITDIKYDEYGNIISYKNSLNSNENIRNTYNEENELVCSYVHTIEYDSDGNEIVNNCHDVSNIRRIEVTKDGLLITTKTSINKNGIEYKNELIDVYSEFGNYIISTINSEGNRTDFIIDEVTELLKEVIEPNNAKTNYTYNTRGDIIKVEKEGTTISYLYDYSNYTIDKIIVNHDTANEIIYDLKYDSLGRLEEVKTGENLLVSNTYYTKGEFSTELLETITYGTNQAYRFIYDENDRIETIQFKLESSEEYVDRYKYKYNSLGLLISYIEINGSNETNYSYSYNKEGQLIGISKNGKKLSESSYDEYGYLQENTLSFNNYTSTIKYCYDYAKGRIDYIDFKNDYFNFKKVYNYENYGLERNIGYDIKNNINKKIFGVNYNYDYDEVNNTFSHYLNSETFSNSNGETLFSYTYEFNNIGFIERITNKDQSHIIYEYDKLGQLVKERSYDNTGTLIYRNEFAYDINGNIRYKYHFVCETCSPSFILSYNYLDSTNKNKLSRLITPYNGKVYEISYDEIGNPISYNGYDYSYEGRRLKTINGNGKNISFEYNDAGIRTSKTVNGSKINYELIGSKIISQTRGENEKLYFNYDDAGRLVSMTYYNGSTYNTYFYVLNILGDVVGLVDKQGNVVVKYLYDAYGNIIDSTNQLSFDLAKLNPFRYRGYYYDEETGWYYLNSRYYNPEIGRFINADGLLGPQGVILGHNMYAYTQNNPVMYYDPDGEFPVLALLTITAIVGLGLTIGGVASDNNTMTAIGLTMVAIPAFVAGGLALGATTGTLAHIVGGVTVAAGLGTSAFATAEFQETITGNNWIRDTTGMSEGWYNGIMIGTAIIATLGTAASSIAYTHNINSIVEFGRYGKEQYRGMKFTQRTSSGNLRIRTLEFHTHPHNGHNPHWQVNKWDGLVRRGTGGRWTWWLKRIGN